MAMTKQALWLALFLNLLLKVKFKSFYQTSNYFKLKNKGANDPFIYFVSTKYTIS